MKKYYKLTSILIIVFFSCTEKNESCVSENVNKNFSYIFRILDFQEHSILENLYTFQKLNPNKEKDIKSLDSLFNLGDSLIDNFLENLEVQSIRNLETSLDEIYTELEKLYLENKRDKKILSRRDVFYHNNLLSNADDKCVERIRKNIIIYQLRSYNTYLKSLTLDAKGISFIKEWEVTH